MKTLASFSKWGFLELGSGLFITSTRTKDGNEYDPTSLWSLMANFERHLIKKGYSANIINDLVFEKPEKFSVPMK